MKIAVFSFTCMFTSDSARTVTLVLYRVQLAFSLAIVLAFA